MHFHVEALLSVISNSVCDTTTTQVHTWKCKYTGLTHNLDGRLLIDALSTLLVSMFFKYIYYRFRQYIHIFIVG